MVGPIIGVVLVAVIVIGYLLTSYYNKKTVIPEDCKEAYYNAQACTLCAQKNGCGLRQTLEEIKEIKV